MSDVVLSVGDSVAVVRLNNPVIGIALTDAL